MGTGVCDSLLFQKNKGILQLCVYDRNYGYLYK